MKKNIISLLFVSFVIFGCADNEKDSVVDREQYLPKITADLSLRHQEMIGFGAALTWWSDRVMSSRYTEEIYDLIFDDLGMDILRLKNWYYPENYPENKDPESMSTSGDKVMFLATNEFYKKAKEYNPQIKILLSSWGPPAALKSNGNLREGTLKKDGDRFMYDEFAEYWEDILNHIDFTPDYISIQNEPGYVNPGWTTCMWAPTETNVSAGLNNALDKVYDIIKNRPSPPTIVGPESENIPAFNNFMPFLTNKDYMPIYAYHPYNFSEGTSLVQIENLLQEMQSRFGDKPNIMTEYSNMSWLKTARFIHRTLTLANTSAYIYWELVWGDINRREYPMINIDGAGNYEVTGFYYLIKHFSKFIDSGYTRINVSTSLQTLEVSAYVNPAETKVTFVIINPEGRELEYQIEVSNKEIKNTKIFQSVEGDYFNEIKDFLSNSKVLLKGNSITTVVIEL